MKLFSSRVESDVEDIMFLYRKLGFTTVDEGLDLVESVYHGRTINPKVQFAPATLIIGFLAEMVRRASVGITVNHGTRNPGRTRVGRWFARQLAVR